MSVISAGTTSTTAFKVTGDTTGTLQLQTGAVPTTAINISASQVVTFPATTTLDFTGSLLLGDGSATAPTLAHSGDTNTGIYFPGADQIAITTAGTQRVYVGATGDVGIGTGSPISKLQVAGQVRISGLSAGNTALAIPAGDILADVSSGAFAIGNYGDASSEMRISTRGFTTFRTGATDGTNGTERMRLDSSGNLGLGVTPDGNNLAKVFQLESGFTMFGFSNTSYLSANAYYNSGWKYKSTAAAAYYEMSGANGHKWSVAASGTAGNAITFTQAMTLQTGASNDRTELLIGTSTVLYSSANRGNITLNGASNAILGLAYGGTAGGYLYTDSGGITLWCEGSRTLNIGTASSGPVTFTTNNTERARITSGGALLVGTTSFTQSGNRGLGVQWSYTGSGGEGGCEFRNTSTSSASDPNPCLILQKGSTTTSSDQRFIQFYANTTSQPMGGIVGNGATNVQFVSLSDARQKTNIQSISGSLEKILALNPVSFDWIKSGEHVKAGFVAQNVEQVFPEFVVENFDTENGEPRKGLTGGMTGGIIAHLVKAIQELSAKVAALESK